MYIEREFEKNCISEDKTIIDALNQLDLVSKKTLFIINANNGALIGSLTDGDVRRALISGHTIIERVGEIAKKDTVVIQEDGYISELNKKARVLMNRYQINVIPMVNVDYKITGLFVDGTNNEIRKKPVFKTVIMAGGKGTRLYPYTKVIPKPLIPVEDIPISERIINSLYEAGCKDFYMIVNYKKNMIKSYYNEIEHGYNLVFCEEERYLGTGGGLKLLEGKVDGTFLLTNCDILILEDIGAIMEHHKQQGNSVTMVCSLKTFEIPYGVVKYNEEGVVEELVEKPRMDYLTNTGYYILDSGVFEYINDDECIGMPDILMRMKNAGLRIGVYPISENRWLDMGQFDSMEAMERRLRELEDDL